MEKTSMLGRMNHFDWNILLFNVVAILLHLLELILRPIYALIHIRRPPSIPPIKNPLLKLSATTLARKIRNGELSSQTVVEAYIERIKEVNPYLNAVIEDRFEAAVDDAKICDKKLKVGKVSIRMLEQEKPLYGVPITVKESCSLKGLSLTGGSLARRGTKATEDGSAIALLKKAGAIPLCVTNTPELCTAFHTTNFLFGATKNPYDIRKTSGGSSGGEGALLGAGASILGIGSDLVGSIRIPSLYNGIFGHKPTPGVIPNRGHFPWSEDHVFQRTLTVGPMARYVEDLHLAMKILSSKYEKDLRLDDPIELNTLRVFYIDNFESPCSIRSTTIDIRQKIEEASHFFEIKGAYVDQLSKEWVDNMFQVLLTFFYKMEIPELFLDSSDSNKEKVPVIELIKATFGLSRYTLILICLELLKSTHAFTPLFVLKRYKDIREILRQSFNSLLKDDGVFICPTYPTTAKFPHSVLFEYDQSVYTALATLLELPSTHVPMGLNDNGMPVGFQVIAGSHQDRLCLAVAKELEKAFGGWIPPSS